MIKINGKYIRNIPEQVGKNKRDIFQLDTDLSALEVKVNEALAGVFHYKGSVATYADLPASDNEIGDVYNVIDTGKNYAWDGSVWDDLGGLVDLSNYYTKAEADTLLSGKAGLATANTFTQDQTINGNIIFPAAGTTIKLANSNEIGITSTEVKFDSNVRGWSNNAFDLGTSAYAWKDLYLSGNISNGTDSVTVADIANGLFNVINASDIVSNTLTQEQYDLITNGRKTIISGTFLFLYDPVILSINSAGNFGIVVGSRGGDEFEMVGININSSRVVSRQSSTAGMMRLNSVFQINGKQIPNYPASTGTFVLKCVDGTLTWVQE